MEPEHQRQRQRAAWKLAVSVHRLLRSRASQPVSTALSESAWEELRRAEHRLNFVQRHEWHVALGRAQRRFEQARSAVVQRLEHLAQRCDERPLVIPSLADVARDLAALEEEFSSVALDDDELVVVSEPVELDGLRLGEFELRLGLATASRRDLPLTVVAVDPHPAQSNDAVVHPHVSDGRLCAGEGQAPLQRAFVDGRLLDLFQIAAQILATYNPGSAYVELVDWEGIRCAACDDLVAELASCGACGDDVCEGCATTCARCDRTVCDGCSGVCTGCAEACCPNCLHGCSACGRPCCDDCLDEGRCSDCLPEPNEEELNHAEDYETLASECAASDPGPAPQCAAIPAAADASLLP